MADVGLDADLVLDIRSALEQTRRIERALDQATTGVAVRITADTRGIPGEISGAVDQADSTVTVTGEAADLTGDVTAAIDAADTTATVTGDASQLTGAVTTAVDEGDSTVIVSGDASQLTGAVTSAVDAGDTDVTITADASGLREAGDASDALNASLIASSRSGVQLRSVLATGFAAAAVAGIGSLINAASDLEQAVGGTRAVFGAAQDTVVDFARGASEAAGLSEEAARRLTSQIGGLLQGFDFTQEEAAETSTVLAQLGADLAATFGGSPEDAVRALGGALRGEFDPLERFGVSLNITQANLKAVELGLADSTSNVSLNARAQASLALIMERSAQAQGQFGREVNTAAGQLERAKAEAANAAAEVGAALLPAFVDLVGVARDSLLPTLQRLGETLGPALGRLLQSSTPLIIGFGQGLAALAPIATAFAAIIDAIPEPVLQLVGTFLAFRAAAGPFGDAIRLGTTALVNFIAPASAVSGITAEVGKGTANAASGFSGMLAAINPVTAALAVAAIGFTIYSQRQAESKKNAAELEAQSDRLAESLNSTEGALAGATAELRDMAQAGDDVVVGFERIGNIDVPLTGTLRSAGLSAREFTEALADSEQPLDRIINRLSQGDNAAALTAASLATLEQEFQSGAQAALDAGVATEKWTQSQVDAAIETNRNADGSRNYLAALDELSLKEAEATAAEEAHTQALTEAQKALADIAAEAPAVGLFLEALGSSTGRSVTNLAGFVVAATEAGLSTEQLATILGQFGGSDAPGFQAAIEAVNETITSLRDAALGTLPSIQDLAGEADAFTLEGFRDELQKGLDAVVNFNANLATIAEQGGPRLAAAAAQLGPEFAQKIAEGIASGNPQVVAETEALLAAIEQAGIDTSSLITGTIGPNLAVATGDMGRLSAAAFGANYVLDASGQIVQVEGQVVGGTPGVAFRNQEMGGAGASAFDTSYTPNAQPGIDSATGQIQAGAEGVAGASKTAGTVGKAGFEGSFTPDPGPAIETAKGIVNAGAFPMNLAGFFLGVQAVAGFKIGVAQLESAASGAAAGAVTGLSSARGAAYAEGFTIGGLLAQGMAQGIRGSAAVVSAAASAAVSSAASAARNAARISSPSKLFADIGVQMGEGMAVGLERASADVSTAASDLSDAARQAAVVKLGTVSDEVWRALLAAGWRGVPGDNQEALFPPVSVPIPVAQTSTPAQGFGAAATMLVVNVAAGAVVIQGTSAPAADIERAAGQLGSAIGRQIKFVARTGG